MKKYLLIILALLFITANVFSENNPVLTVLDFRVNAISENDMKTITSFLSASLHETGRYTVIDTAQRDTILDELSFSNSGCTDESCMLEIGKLLSAQFIVTGDIALLDGRYILTARILETETSATIHTAKNIYKGLGDLIDDMPAFADTLSGGNKAETVATAEKSKETEKPEETVLPADTKKAEPVSTGNIVGWSLAGTGIAMAGTGTYFLIDSIVKLNAVNNAEAAYMAAAAADADYTTLYTTYETAFNAAEYSNTLFFVGAGLISGGVVTSLLSLFFFDDEAETTSDIAFSILPGIESTAIKVSFSY